MHSASRGGRPGDGRAGGAHQFQDLTGKAASTTCGLCRTTVKGHARRCNVCQMTVHAACEPRVNPATCTQAAPRVGFFHFLKMEAETKEREQQQNMYRQISDPGMPPPPAPNARIPYQQALSDSRLLPQVPPSVPQRIGPLPTLQPHQEAVPHTWSRFAVSGVQYCAYCRFTIGSNSIGQGLECQGCRITVHIDCASRLHPCPSPQPMIRSPVAPTISAAGRGPAGRQTDEQVAFDRKYKRTAKILGRGAFGVVVLCECKVTGKPRAVKIINTKRFKLQPNAKIQETLMREIEVMKKIGKHPGIVELVETFEGADQMELVMEYIGSGSLQNHILNQEPDPRIPEEEAMYLTWQICVAIQFLHHQHICHRDLKPDNVLLQTINHPRFPLQCKLADFGFAKVLDDEQYTETTAGTLAFMAPEIRYATTGERYTKIVDMWSLGVVLYTMIAGRIPFENSRVQVTEQNLDLDSGVWANVSASAKDLIRGLLAPEPNDRLSSDDAVEHEWFKNAELQDLYPALSRETETDEGLEDMYDYINPEDIRQLSLEDVPRSPDPQTRSDPNMQNPQTTWQDVHYNQFLSPSSQPPPLPAKSVASAMFSQGPPIALGVPQQPPVLTYDQLEGYRPGPNQNYGGPPGQGDYLQLTDYPYDRNWQTPARAAPPPPNTSYEYVDESEVTPHMGHPQYLGYDMNPHDLNRRYSQPVFAGDRQYYPEHIPRPQHSPQPPMAAPRYSMPNVSLPNASTYQLTTKDKDLYDHIL